MSDGFEGYDAHKLQSPEDAGFYRFPRELLCMCCGEACDGLLCEDCADERVREGDR